MNDYQIGDIIYFKNYIFTDTNQSARHFALVLLPSSVMDFDSAYNLLCSVITSKETKYLSLKLLRSKYKCFDKDSYVCFNRRDINSIYDLDENFEQPCAKLDRMDMLRAFKILKNSLFSPEGDKYLKGVLIREWKKIRDNLL